MTNFRLILMLVSIYHGTPATIENEYHCPLLELTITRKVKLLKMFVFVVVILCGTTD